VYPAGVANLSSISGGLTYKQFCCKNGYKQYEFLGGSGSITF
jgi:hypothetical protein